MFEVYQGAPTAATPETVSVDNLPEPDAERRGMSAWCKAALITRPNVPPMIRTIPSPGTGPHIPRMYPTTSTANGTRSARRRFEALIADDVWTQD